MTPEETRPGIYVVTEKEYDEDGTFVQPHDPDEGAVYATPEEATRVAVDMLSVGPGMYWERTDLDRGVVRAWQYPPADPESENAHFYVLSVVFVPGPQTPEEWARELDAEMRRTGNLFTPEDYISESFRRGGAGGLALDMSDETNDFVSADGRWRASFDEDAHSWVVSVTAHNAEEDRS